jgi:hypothetical protein
VSTDGDFYAGDTSPAFTATLSNVDRATKVSTAANLTGATVAVHFLTPDVPLSVAATIVDAATGVVSYEWVTGDLTDARVGVWDWEAQVTFSNGKIQTFPGGTFRVAAQLA